MKTSAFALLLSALLFGGFQAASGKPTAPQVQPTPKAAQKSKAVPRSSAAANRKKLRAMIDRIAKQRGLDKAIVHAIIAAESAYNPKAVSPKGAIGLMQVMPSTAADYGIRDPDRLFNPETNVRVGTRHFQRLFKKYKNLSRAIMAYNAGEGAVARGKGLLYAETRQYTQRVLNHYWRNKGKKGLYFQPTRLKSGRIRLRIPSAIGSLDSGLHALGPKSKPMFVLESKD